MNVKISTNWNILQTEFDKPYFIKLVEFVKNEYNSKNICPPPTKIFRAFDECPFDQIKVVILGQDPYHTKSVADGLAFSSSSSFYPPSLRNIYEEIKREYPDHKSQKENLSLQYLTSQGVLLLNSYLTVIENQPLSHSKIGWEQFTDNVIKLISENRTNIVFLLWGSYARSKKSLIDTSKHLILESAHPSPLSAYRGFIGNNHFILTNQYLSSKNKDIIVWI